MMNKSFGLLVCVSVCFIGLFTFVTRGESGAEAAQVSATTSVEQTQFEYGQLEVFENETYTWTAGDVRPQLPQNLPVLIARLGGNPSFRSFATLLDTLGSQGWEVVFAVDNDKRWVFRRETSG